MELNASAIDFKMKHSLAKWIIIWIYHCKCSFESWKKQNFKADIYY